LTDDVPKLGHARFRFAIISYINSNLFLSHFEHYRVGLSFLLSNLSLNVQSSFHLSGFFSIAFELEMLSYTNLSMN
jgi:hypothetical protein